MILSGHETIRSINLSGNLSDKVGINNNNPLHNLDVNGTVATNLFISSIMMEVTIETRFGTDSDYYAGFMWNNTSTSYGDGDDFTIFTYGNRNIYLNPGSGKVQVKGGDFIVDNGLTGLGESNPDSKLEVSGRIHSIHEEPGEPTYGWNVTQLLAMEFFKTVFQVLR